MHSCLALWSSITRGLVLLILSENSPNYKCTKSPPLQTLEIKAHVVCECLTLSADHYERYLRDRPVDSELVVDSVNFLEAGLVFQTEDQDYCIHPTCKLKRREEEKSGTQNT